MEWEETAAARPLEAFARCVPRCPSPGPLCLHLRMPLLTLFFLPEQVLSATLWPRRLHRRSHTI